MHELEIISALLHQTLAVASSHESEETEGEKEQGAVRERMNLAHSIEPTGSWLLSSLLVLQCGFSQHSWQVERQISA